MLASFNSGPYRSMPLDRNGANPDMGIGAFD